jgi:multidrug transporter EmrE-like cation transporter
VILSATGLALLKISHATPAILARVPVPPPMAVFTAGLTLYAVSFAIWTWLLGRLPLSVAYPMAAGATLVATSLLAWLLFDERLTLLKLAGIGLVFLGILALTAPST